MPSGPPVFVNPDQLARQNGHAPVFVTKQGAVAGAGPAPGAPVFVTKDGTVVGRGGPGPSPIDESRPWGWWLGPTAIMIAFFAVLMLGAIVAIIGGGDSSQILDDNEEWFGLAQDILWVAVAITVPYLFFRYLRPEQLGLRKPAQFGRSVGVFFGALVAFYVIAALYSSLAGLTDDSNELLQDTGIGDGVVKDVAYALLFTVAAPVAEELLFRGLLFRSLRDGFHRLGPKAGPFLGALISGVIFGGIHLGGGQDDFLPVLMVLGVLLALAYHLSGTLYVPIALHAVNNAIATGTSSTPAADWIYGLIALGPVIAVITAMLIGRFVKSVFPQERPGSGVDNPAQHGGDAFPRPNYRDEFFGPPPTRGG